MNRLSPEIIEFYDRQVAKEIAEKYSFSFFGSLTEFVGNCEGFMSFSSFATA